MKTQKLVLGAFLALGLASTSLANGDETKRDRSSEQIAQQVSRQFRYPEFVRQLPGNREVIVYFHLNEDHKVIVDKATSFDKRLELYVKLEMERLELVMDESASNKPLSLKLRFK